MVVWVQLKHGYESIRAGKNFTHICLMVPGLSRHLFTHSIGLFLSQYSSILTPSSPAEWRQIWQKSSPWEDKTVEERRKRKQSNCFLATRPFPGKMRSCISAAVEKTHKHKHKPDVEFSASASTHRTECVHRRCQSPEVQQHRRDYEVLSSPPLGCFKQWS